MLVTTDQIIKILETTKKIITILEITVDLTIKITNKAVNFIEHKMEMMLISIFFIPWMKLIILTLFFI